MNWNPAWLSAVEVCPPSSAECLSVSLDLFRRWLRNEAVVDETGDVLGEIVSTIEGNQKPGQNGRTVLVWRGKQSKDKDQSS